MKNCILLSILCLLFLSCGLLSIESLFPPLGSSQGTNKDMSFFHNALNSNSSSFLGYELLYCIYDTIEDAEADRGIIEQYNTSEPTSLFSRMTSLKYSKMTGSTYELTTVPLIEITPVQVNSTNIEIKLSFSNVILQIAPSLYIDSIDNGSLKRIVTSITDSSMGKDFYSLSQFETGNDIKKHNPNSTDAVEKYFLQVFGLAYGISISSPFYSQATFLGVLEIEPND